MTTIATDLRLKPQTKQVLLHLREYGSISPVEAQVAYGNFRLAAAIYDLRDAGYTIPKQFKHDASGHGYTRYFMTKVKQ